MTRSSRDFPFPKIYMYEFVDLQNRSIRKEIVDGQQRINTIIRFYHNKLRLRGESRYAGQYFDDLDAGHSGTVFWHMPYQLMLFAMHLDLTSFKCSDGSMHIHVTP